MKFIDLFCGIGGFHQALRRLNHECVFACDIDKDAREIYSKNYSITPEGDITKIDYSTIPDFDILTAGFPCQSYSNAGKKKGFSDKRGKLFDNIITIVKLHKPKFMFFENVKHIKKIDSGKVFEYICNEITEAGYNLQIFELSPHQLGIPQHRERIIFSCIRNDIYIGITTKLDLSPIKTVILEKNVNVKYRITPEQETVLETWELMIKKFKIGENLSPTILINEYHNNYTEDELLELVKWKQDCIVKNKRIFKDYSKEWNSWYLEHSEIFKKKEIYGKL